MSKNPPPIFRIITRNFPHYKLAEHDDINVIKTNWEFVTSVLEQVEGKVTSKKIVKYLKAFMNATQLNVSVSTISFFEILLRGKLINLKLIMLLDTRASATLVVRV